MDNISYKSDFYPVSIKVVCDLITALGKHHLGATRALKVEEDIAAKMHVVVDEWYRRLEKAFTEKRKYAYEVLYTEAIGTMDQREQTANKEIRATGIDSIEKLVRSVYPHLLLALYSANNTQVLLPGETLLQLIRWYNQTTQYLEANGENVDQITADLLKKSGIQVSPKSGGTVVVSGLSM